MLILAPVIIPDNGMQPGRPQLGPLCQKQIIQVLSPRDQLQEPAQRPIEIRPILKRVAERWEDAASHTDLLGGPIPALEPLPRRLPGNGPVAVRPPLAKDLRIAV
jgi:hypothetical protein